MLRGMIFSTLTLREREGLRGMIFSTLTLRERERGSEG